MVLGVALVANGMLSGTNIAIPRGTTACIRLRSVRPDGTVKKMRWKIKIVFKNSAIYTYSV